MDNRPIGIMDSGVGGLTAVKALMEQLPHESFIYVGDMARLPYGPRAQEEVATFVEEIGYFLEKNNVKLLLIACNTATVAGLELVQKQLSIPVVGMIHPGSVAATRASRNHHYGVFATEGTVKTQAYKKMIQSLDEQAVVTEVACPSFVTLVEQHHWQDALAEVAVEEAFEQLMDDAIDTLILGCTHFPILQPVIESEAPHHMTLINPGAASIQEVQKTLEKEDALSMDEAQYVFYTTGDVEGFEGFIQDWLGVLNPIVLHLDEKELTLND